MPGSPKEPSPQEGCDVGMEVGRGECRVTIEAGDTTAACDDTDANAVVMTVDVAATVARFEAKEPDGDVAVVT